MRRVTITKIMDILDNERLSREEKTQKILAIFLKQKTIDWILLKGILRELGQEEIINKIEAKRNNNSKDIKN